MPKPAPGWKKSRGKLGPLAPLLGSRTAAAEGVLADVRDVHPDAVGFEAQMPAGVTVCTTDRLVLRRLTAADAAFVLEQVNEPSFLRNIGDRGVRTLDDARAYVENGPVAMYARHGFGLYFVTLKDTATPIGMCGLLKRDTLEDVDIGFAFLPRYWGKGYALEAASAVMAHGRDVLGIKRIVAITAPDNEPSIKLLKKIGLTFDRMIRLPGEESDSRLFVPAGETRAHRIKGSDGG